MTGSDELLTLRTEVELREVEIRTLRHQLEIGRTEVAELTQERDDLRERVASYGRKVVEMGKEKVQLTQERDEARAELQAEAHEARVLDAIGYRASKMRNRMAARLATLEQLAGVLLTELAEHGHGSLAAEPLWAAAKAMSEVLATGESKEGEP